MKGWLALTSLAALAGCTTERIEDVAPRILWSLDEKSPAIAFVPGTELDVFVEWAALCRTEGIPDTSTTKTCDDQAFLATVHCEGAPCEIDPPAASAGLELKGQGRVSVRAAAPGDLTIEVALEHLGTHEQLVKRGVLAIRDLERVVDDCIYQAYDPTMPRCEQRTGYILCQDRPWLTCPASAAVDPVWGTPISLWIYGEGGGYPISPTTTIPSNGRPLRPIVTFGALVPTETDYVQGGHADARAGSNALKFQASPKTAGTLSVHASIGGFTADRVTQLQ